MSRPPEQIPRLNTIGVIARRLKVSKMRVEYVLRTREYIQPSAYAGNARLYDHESLVMIRHELIKIQDKKKIRSTT